MVFTNKYTETLIDKFQNFKNSISFIETIDLYSDGTEKVNINTIFSALTNYVADELIKKNKEITNEEVDIYKFVEEIRQQYSGFEEGTPEREMDSAACTCFLENLLNRASWNDIEYRRFIPYLGVKSKEFCRAWDEYTGVKSPGLWDDK